MAGNFKSIKVVAGMIGRSHKHLQFDIYDIVEWCAEAIKNTGNFESFRHYFWKADECCKIIVKNRQVLLPCNVYRLLGIYHHGQPLNNTDFIRENDYLRMIRHHEDNEVIEIDYLGILVDEEGFPMVDELQLDACYYYCLKMMMMEDFTNGKIQPAIFEYIDEQYGKYVQKARSSFKNTSRNDMDEIAMILYNAIPRVRLPKNMT